MQYTHTYNNNLLPDNVLTCTTYTRYDRVQVLIFISYLYLYATNVHVRTTPPNVHRPYAPRRRHWLRWSFNMYISQYSLLLLTCYYVYYRCLGSYSWNPKRKSSNFPLARSMSIKLLVCRLGECVRDVYRKPLVALSLHHGISR